ncbi:GC-rich sequence DNA-binding factor-like domain [Arabidopsis suecica]|uniref:GC-rich sequence DNA-binding factor-like domain n=1 Tax=Arabidopsis suecica TaxID=45249 RepID=A0A8T1Z9G2_ARASU|nr:GC-rich sequence DNA-binding factor-like domain [Arabidopsis suecica]
MGSNRPRNFRRRGDDGGDEIDGKVATPAAKPTSTPSSSKPKTLSASAPKKKLLSFADDEEEEEDGAPRVTIKPKNGRDRVKSSSRLGVSGSSHRHSSTKEHRPASSISTVAPLSNVLPQAGSYSKEALLELQKNTRTLPYSRPSANAEPKVVLKGLIKPPHEHEQQQSLKDVVKQVSDLDFDEDGEGEQPEDAFADQAAIIRAKKERMRQSRSAPAPDYISLDGGTANHSAVEGVSDEDADFQGIFVGPRPHKGEKKGVFDFGDENPTAKETTTSSLYEDEDEEEKLWEEEQFKKGIGKRMDEGSHRTVTSNGIGVPLHSNQQSLPQQQPQMYAYHAGTPMPNVSVAPTIGPATSVDTLPMSQQAELAKKALKNNVKKLKESHAKTLSSLTKTDENLTASLMSITDLESSLSAAGDKYVFMQKLRDFISVICDFMQNKGSLIEEIEDQMKELNEKHALSILERRIADNNDEMLELGAAVKAAMTVLNKQGSSNSVIAAATSAALAASASIRQQMNQPVKLDEFGRDENLQKRREVEQRAAARQKRRARFENKRASAMEIEGSSLKIEGESSTDESDTETSAYKETRDNLLQCADKVFSDASEEYSQLSRVKARFERWKRDYSSTYRDAYMSLTVPSIFSPYVRLELLKWDPLHQDVDFFDMKWHGLLFDYGKPEDGDDFAPDDTDANLVPELVEKVAIPILHHQIVRCWDILSTRETRNAVAATSLVTNYVSASSEALAELFAAIRARLVEAIAAISVPTWDPLVLKAVPNAPQVAAYRFGTSVRLMRNICMWKDILALSVLENLALSDLLFGKVLPHVRSIASNIHDAVTRTERIVASLSGVWTGPSVTRTHSRPLQPLVDCTLTLRRILEKRLASGLDDAETTGLARRLKRILVELHEHDHAREIVRTFNLKEAV